MKWNEKALGKTLEIRGLSPIVSQILASRINVDDKQFLNEFMNPSLSYLNTPDKLMNMDKGVDAVTEVINNNGKITVHADYDADGITSAVVLAKTLTVLGADFTVWLPHRMLDGYGMSSRFVNRAIEEKPDLIITVDCGISEGEHISQLAKAGIKVVITDHHKVGEDGIPKDAVAVIDPKQPDEKSSFKDFAGVGVTFKFCWELCNKNKDKLKCKVSTFLKQLIPYVAIGTVADVMPLVGENRHLVHAGIKMIKEEKVDVGILDLIEASKIHIESLNARDIGYMIAPRINSAGRMDDPSVAFRCFFCGDRSAAGQLDMFNESRKDASENVFKQAEQQIKNNPDDPVILVAQEKWHEGVLGIAAGKLSEKYGRPAIVLSVTADKAKGSGRSAGGVNLHEVVSQCAEHLGRFGGHAQALGVSLNPDKIEDFRLSLKEAYKHLNISLEAPELSINIDSVIQLKDITDNLIYELAKLEPYGEANPEPIFACKSIKLADMRTMGKNSQHFSATALKEGRSSRVICFNAGNMMELVEKNLGSDFDIAFIPSHNTYNGRTSIQLMLKDIKLSK